MIGSPRAHMVVQFFGTSVVPFWDVGRPFFDVTYYAFRTNAFDLLCMKCRAWTRQCRTFWEGDWTCRRLAEYVENDLAISDLVTHADFLLLAPRRSNWLLPESAVAACLLLLVCNDQEYFPLGDSKNEEIGGS